MPDTTLTLTKPDDLHLHVRDGAMMDMVLPHTARSFARATIMPNLSPPVVTAEQAQAYKSRIEKSLEKSKIADFQPLMTSYLTNNTDPKDIESGFSNGILHAIKMYPANATTNSEFGLTDFFQPKKLYEVLSEIGMPLLIHGELNETGIDIYDKEKLFINNVLKKLVDTYPKLKIVLEHITTEESVKFVLAVGDNVAATITPHHLHINRSDMFAGGRIRPHLFCLPIAKREHHREALVQAATSGDKSFFAGTDSAPHAKGDKESACGCAGIFNAGSALCDYAEVFDKAGALDKLEAFTSHFGADFYGLPRNKGTVTITRKACEVPTHYTTSDNKIVIPFRAGESIPFQIVD